MRSLPAPARPPLAPCQLGMPFDSARLRGMSPAERRTALGRLARLLLEAAGVAAVERDDDLSADLLPAAVLKRKAVATG